MALGCSNEDEGASSISEKERSEQGKEEAQDPDPSIFEADIDLVDEKEELKFKATGDQVQAMWGDIDFEGTSISNLFVLEVDEDNSAQQLTLLAAGITGEGTYTFDKEGFEVATFSRYQKDKQESDLSKVYTFHEQNIDVGDKTYQTEVVLKITSLTSDRVKGTLDIVMYASVLEYEGEGESKTLKKGVVRKGVVKGTFDSVLVKP